MSAFIKTAERLHTRGWAIHWLKPRSKAPVESGWTSGERDTFESLLFKYAKGMNVGVRLGHASKVDGGFLAVIDCDVKSTAEKHEREMLAKLADLGVDRALMVVSGRGNGSRHYYVRTKTPAQPMRFSQSSEKVRVLMPSVKKYTPAEEKAFTAAELEEGWRLRPAWEISIMGEGQQVVLPPSTHPDSGRSYEWEDETADIPWFTPLAATRGPESAKVELRGFKPVEVDLIGSGLTSRVVDMIVRGDGVTDRSASLMTACRAMLKERFTDDEILSVLTDPENYLASAALERRGGSRKSAAEWIATSTLAKAKHSVSAVGDFEAVPMEESDELSDEAAEAQVEELCTTDWKMKIDRAKSGLPHPSFRNAYIIVKGEGGAGSLLKNEFTNADVYGADTPWGGKKGAELRDIDTVRIKAFLAEKYRVEPRDGLIMDACKKVGDENKFHPVQDFLSGLEWDGVERLDGWLKHYMNAKGPEPYLSEVSRKTLVGMVARVKDPGCLFAQVLIMEGAQGCGKSSAVRILSQPWFSDAPFVIGDKDTVLLIHTAWVFEIGELSSTRQAEVEKLKAFISQRVDRIRPPYGRRPEDFKRQSIFIGTTNNDDYLKDISGNRRFWPVKVGRCRFAELEHDRDQLLAEALFMWGLGENINELSPEADAQAYGEQELRVAEDSWVEIIRDALTDPATTLDPEKFTMSEMFSDRGPLWRAKDDKANQNRAAGCFKVLGYHRVRESNEKGRFYYWVRRHPLPAPKGVK